MDEANKNIQLRDAVNKLSSLMYTIYVDWKVNQTVPSKYDELIAENMYRMMIFKAKSISTMSNGITIIPTQKGIIPDPSTIYPVLRSMYELLFLFRCIYVSSRNEVERNILLNIWTIRGNNNLIRIPDEELDVECRKKKKTAKEENKTLRMKIREQMKKLVLTQPTIDKIEIIIKNKSPTLKGFKFEHCEHCDNITDFCALDISNGNMGLQLSGVSYIYSHYSAHSHPSSLGVKHFEEMYYNKDEYKFMTEILEYTCLYLAHFMNDFCIYKESYRSFYIQNEIQISKILSII
ncbi:hypothetical protein M1D30_10840 [Prevotella sp. E15-22]|uniref:hypothetical protein n=1 Tax=Prevotella sp. E15-22 TaxID=2937774 RepID=UPI002048857D|nr:hypothetical protein [Prevotella sp. E15-22]UPS44060.1 hypothetical protein M1D30_10840 [Prevotella sp. E15-22]